MALTQIQKSSTFKPEMIGDVVEVTVYDQKDGSLSTVTGVLAAYSSTPEVLAFKIDGITDSQVVPREGYTLSVTHYEFNLGSLVEEEEDE